MNLCHSPVAHIAKLDFIAHFFVFFRFFSVHNNIFCFAPALDSNKGINKGINTHICSVDVHFSVQVVALAKLYDDENCCAA